MQYCGQSLSSVSWRTAGAAVAAAVADGGEGSKTWSVSVHCCQSPYYVWWQKRVTVKHTTLQWKRTAWQRASQYLHRSLSSGEAEIVTVITVNSNTLIYTCSFFASVCVCLACKCLACINFLQVVKQIFYQCCIEQVKLIEIALNGCHLGRVGGK